MAVQNIKDYKEGVPSPSCDTNINVEETNEERLFVFFSLDICNSTKMKDCVKNWKEVILTLYKSDIEFQYMRLWKFIGDEIVFYIPYHGLNDFVSLIEQAYNKIEAVEDELTKIIKNNDKDSDYTVKVKGAMWLAYISNKDSNKNVYVSNIDEFIGKQIDEGFRMSNYSSDRKLLLDPKIVFVLLTLFCADAAYISTHSRYKEFSDQFLSNIDPNIIESSKNKLLESSSETIRNKISNIVENIQFIKYEYLKGIWGGSPYPIYWYFRAPDTLKYYDILNNDPLPILYKQDDNTYISQQRYYSKDLFNIFQTVQAEKEVEDILGVVSKDDILDAPFARSGMAQLYYSIACIKDGKVLVVQRSFSRKHLCGVWEFGFQKHTDVSIYDNICNFFKTEFGITVHPITDGTEENNIIPLHFCTTYRNTIKHNSILCCADIISDKTVDELKSQINDYIKNRNKDESKKKQYLQVEFVDENEAAKKFTSLTLKDVEDDSYRAQIGESLIHNKNSSEPQKAIMYFLESIESALHFRDYWHKLEDKKWNKFFLEKG